MESTGFPLHLHEGKNLNLKTGIGPSPDRVQEIIEKIRKEQDQGSLRDTAPQWVSMPTTGSIKSLVIFVKPFDRPNAVFNNNGYLDNYQNGHSVKDYFYAQSPTLCHSERSEESITV